MKLPGVKNLNWKQFFIDHGEKLLFGGVALLGLGALGVSRWAPYSEKSPYGLLTDVAAAKKQHETSVWPDAERQEYDPQEDISAKARQLLSPLDDQQYAFGRTLPYMYWPVIPQKQLIEEPKWFAVERLEATTGRVLYAKAPSMDEALAALENPDAEGAEDEDEPQRNTPRGIDLSDFRPSSRRPQGLPGMEAPGLDAETYAPPEADAGAAPRGRNPRGRGAAGARGGSSSGARGSGGGARGGGARGGASSGAMPAPGVDFYGGSGMDMYGMEGGYGMAGPIEGVAKRFVSVRGVFPIKNQERELARALGLQSPSQLVNALQFVDFELERQRAVQGADPWAGSWEKVDIQIAHDVLNEQANFSADIVDPSVTNSVFTMPLPGRVIGEWDDEDASHPALTQFDLTEDAKKQQQWLQTKIAEYAARLEEEGKMMPQVGGFGSQQYDARQVGGMMMMNEGYMNEMTSGMGGMGMSGMTQPMAGRQGQTAPKVTKEDIKAMLSASGTYLLFRYLDFDVRPGNAYRYRVRLKVVNPSFGRDPGEAKDRYVVEEQYRFTEWSQPTAASIVPEDTRHFLVEIDQPVTNQADRATFEVFQWSDKFGTFVGEFLAVEPGQFIGGTAKTDVLDPAAQTFEEQDFTFTSNDVLVDIDRNAFNVASRPEMGVTDRRFRIPAQVLTVNEWGKLEVQDPVSTAGTRVAWENALKGLAEDFAHLKDKAATTGEAGMEYMEADMYSGAMSGGARGGANPLRRGRGRGAASSSGDVMMEGMGGEGMGGGRPRPRQR